jgi:hypothetical protein
MCTICRMRRAAEPDGLCSMCDFHIRIEFALGFRRLTEYLAAWESFAEWLHARGLGAA